MTRCRGDGFGHSSRAHLFSGSHSVTLSIASSHHHVNVSSLRSVIAAPSAQQIAENGVRRFVERLEVANIELLVEHQLGEFLEEAARLAGADDQSFVAVAVDADYLRQFQEGDSELVVVVAGNADGQRMIVEQVTDLRERA